MLTMTWNKTNSACECWFSCFTRSYAKSISSINPNGMKNEEKMQNIKMMLFREKKVHFDEKVVGKLKYMNSDWKQCLVFSSIKICTNSVWGNRPNIHESMISSKKKSTEFTNVAVISTFWHFEVKVAISNWLYHLNAS